MAPRAAEAGHRTLVLRVASAIVLVAVTAGAIFAGPPVFDLYIGIAALVLGWEWLRLCRYEVASLPGAALLLSLVATVLAASQAPLPYAFAAMGAGAVITLAAGYLGAGAERPWPSLGALYIGLPAIAFISIMQQPAGREILIWLIAAVAATDICAYFAGRGIGGPRLWPRVSPNKTWAGLAGGVAGAALTGVAFALASDRPAGLFALLSAALALVSQAGDLLESSVKRRFGVKDSSGIIPGHGGLFDRVDGQIAAAVAVAAVSWATGGND